MSNKIAGKELASNVDVREAVDLQVTKPIFEKNKIMEFQLPEGKLKLEFELLNYSEFVEKEKQTSLCEYIKGAYYYGGVTNFMKILAKIRKN